MTRSLCLALGAACIASACATLSGPPSATVSVRPGDSPPDTVVATIGPHDITLGQLDDEIGPQLHQLDEEAATKRASLRRDALEQLIPDRVVQAAAKERGVTPKQYLEVEIDNQVKPPTDAEIHSLFNEVSARLPEGATVDGYRDQIVEYFTNTRKNELRRELYRRLRKEQGVTIGLHEDRRTVASSGPSKGPSNAPVTIIEFSDFECPYCARVRPTLQRVLQTYSGKVRLVYRHFPLSFHPHSQKASEAALCADEQGKFWEYHDLLFQNQSELELDNLKSYARTLGLDADKFGRCLDGGKFAAAVQRDADAGASVGVNGTPAFFINGRMLSGALPFEDFQRIIDEELGS